MMVKVIWYNGENEIDRWQNDDGMMVKRKTKCSTIMKRRFYDNENDSTIIKIVQ